MQSKARFSSKRGRVVFYVTKRDGNRNEALRASRF